MSKPLSVCIVTYNNEDKAANAVSSVKKHTALPYTLFISDNGSTDGTVKAVCNVDSNAVIIENGGNLGFGKAHNKVLGRLDSKYHAVVNPDITIDYDVFSEICEYMDKHPEVVMATPKILSVDGSEQHLPKRLPKLKYLAARRLKLSKKLADEYTRADEVIDKPIEIDFCTGCFFVIRTEVFEKIGGFDERFFMYFEDTDITVRSKQYGRVMFLPDSHVTHIWEQSSAKSIKYLAIHISSMFKFFWKYKGRYGKTQ